MKLPWRLKLIAQVYHWFPPLQASIIDGVARNEARLIVAENLYLPGVMLLQYWRSFDDLENFARNPSEPHLAAWKRYNQAVGAGGSVGIFHETYQIAAGGAESVYGNMPVFGLAKATRHVPAVGRRETARQRLGGENTPAVISPQQPDH